MSNAAKPAFLCGRGNRGRGRGTGDRNIQQSPGQRQNTDNKAWRNWNALSAGDRVAQDSATFDSHFGGTSTRERRFSMILFVWIVCRIRPGENYQSEMFSLYCVSRLCAVICTVI